MAIAPITCAQGSAGPSGLNPINITKIDRGVRASKPIAGCEFDNGICRIDSGSTVSTTYSGDVSISISVINAKAGASYTESYTTAVGCTSETLEPGQVVFQFARGDLVHYTQIRVGVTLTGSAFIPNGAICKVYNKGQYSQSWWGTVLNRTK
ncbi:hypothetical protein [Nocardia brasiliensis]|uniref:Uncharacterized protein n=1 Tax=Nocardia brasiliensis (strain ATCC 700358 / HUJEG-1) TaxID=1133849 RepID=K0F0D6_NOCB7|nr:hypothetical protein [Nocardia brasiliensis]AFU02625.1 hypothetical protein O3I_023350 [Nocardia brasiliensis ATCC 700358]OCF84751.1 hypothetical protein AW168_39715 [Nocardia brasiliensis]